QLPHESTWVASQNDWFYSQILSLDIGGKVQKVLLRDMQRHPYKQIIMHLDFQRVNENEAVRVAVPIHFLNEDTSPAGKAADVAVTHELNEILVSCLPKDLPEYLEVDLGALEVGDTIHLSQVKLPEGVEVPELKLGPDHDVAIAVARYVKEEIEEEVVAEEGDAEVPATKVEGDDEAAAGDEDESK
ncbi:MAG: 50S ribosomal protein L25/general stress protein Ctc, partial [Pseudomonadota bacterium]|nr:50S ribosomal protein L25/general stress protein Ctc [Pseudomonadota bacterium]